MGGSVAVHVAATKAMPNVHGLVVVDVVEVCFMLKIFILFHFNFLSVLCESKTSKTGNGHGIIDPYAENPVKSNAILFRH